MKQRTPSAAPKSSLGAFFKHRRLTLEMTKHEIKDRYAGQMLGAIWAVGHPLILMSVYVFLFSVVFKARMGGTRDLPLNYTVYLLSGLISWLSFQESMVKASTVITSNSNLVRQVVFPLHVLPLKCVFASLFPQLFTTLFLVLYIQFQFQGITPMFLLWPAVFGFQVLAMSGAAYLLSAVGCYFRDIKDIIQVFLTVGMFITPIVYPPAWVPQAFKPILYVNPFSYMIWCYQDVFYFGGFEHAWAWPLFAAGSLVLFIFGYGVFNKLKVQFANVL